MDLSLKSLPCSLLGLSAFLYRLALQLMAQPVRKWHFSIALELLLSERSDVTNLGEASTNSAGLLVFGERQTVRKRIERKKGFQGPPKRDREFGREPRAMGSPGRPGKNKAFKRGPRVEGSPGFSG